MEYTNSFTTRHWYWWTAALFSFFFGVPITVAFSLGVSEYGWASMMSFGLAIGIWFLIGFCYFTWKLAFPQSYEGRVSANWIVCKTNGEVVHHINRQEIRDIDDSATLDIISVNLKDGSTIDVAGWFLMDLQGFRQALRDQGYPVEV